MIDEPFFLPGDEYEVRAGRQREVGPQIQLPREAGRACHERLERSIQSQHRQSTLAHMFGRGLVHPVDMQNPDNPPSNPELLQLLAQQIAAMKFDMRAFLREIALSNAYQRSFDPPADLASLADKAAKEVCAIAGGAQAARQGGRSIDGGLLESNGRLGSNWKPKSLPVAGELDTAKTKYADAKKKADEAAKAAADAESQLKAKKTVATPVQQAATAAQEAIKVCRRIKSWSTPHRNSWPEPSNLRPRRQPSRRARSEKRRPLRRWPTPGIKPSRRSKRRGKRSRHSRSSLKEAEKAMLAARDKAANDKESLESLDRRLATAQKVAKCPD